MTEAYYANVPDLTELPKLIRQTVAGWIDKDAEPHMPDGRVDEIYLPITAEDEEQLQARVEILEGEGPYSWSVRTKKGPTPSTQVDEPREAVQDARESIRQMREE